MKYEQITVTNDLGGRMPSVKITIGRFVASVGWVTRWTTGISWFLWKCTQCPFNGVKYFEIHLGRFRIGAGFKATAQHAGN